MLKVNLNTSYQSHAIIGLVLGIWLVLFLIFIAPFDTSDLSLELRFLLLPPYGFIFFTVYLLTVAIQNWVYKKTGTWNLFLEIGAVFLFYFSALIPIYLYYKTEMINGDFSFRKFHNEVYFPIFLILSALIFFGRWFVTRKQSTVYIEQPIVVEKAQSTKLILKGENKLDLLQVAHEELVCISSAQNYVEVYFLQNKILQKKLLRTTLKKIRRDTPDLVQVHRSHLINPIHFVKWSGQNSITIHELEIPVSKSYKEQINNVI